MPKRVGGVRGKSSTARWDRKLSPSNRRKLNRKARRNSAPTAKAAAAKAKTRSPKQEHRGQKSRPKTKARSKTPAAKERAKKKQVNQRLRSKQSNSIAELQAMNRRSRGVGLPQVSISKIIKGGYKPDRANANGYGQSAGRATWPGTYFRKQKKLIKKNSRAGKTWHW